MKISISEFREWLERHKIFFEIFSWIGLGGMGIIVSLVALNVSSKQAVIAERQAQIAHAAQSPFVWVREYLVKNDESGNYEDVILEITNEGYRLGSFTSNVRAFFTLSTYDSKQGKLGVHVPVTGYYFSSFHTARPTGTLATIKGHKNHLSFSKPLHGLLETVSTFRS